MKQGFDIIYRSQKISPKMAMLLCKSRTELMRLVEVWCMGILLLLSLMVSGICFIAPHMTSGPFHPYKLDETISNFRGV